MFFSQNVFSKPWNHFGNDDDSIAYSVSQQILDLKYLNFRAKKNDLKVMLNFGAKIQIWEKNHSESLKDLNFGVKKSTFKSWALLARKLKKKLNFRAIKLCSFLARKLKYENSHSDWSKDFNFGAKIQHSNHGHFWRENSNMLKKSFWKFKSFEFWRQKTQH